LSVGFFMGEERRKYYRYPLQEGSEAVVVRHQGVERPAKLINLSADGFRLDMDEESIVEVGDIVLMATSSGFHRVRVMNVARGNGTLQLGLQRLQDLSASAVESQAEGRRPRRKRREKPSVASSFLQLSVPIGLTVLILGTAVWAWTADADPVGAVVEDRTFVTPTSAYSARRRRQAEVEENISPIDQPKRRGPRLAEGEPGSPQWSPGGRSTAAAEGKSPRTGSLDEPGSERPNSSAFADTRGSSSAESVGSGGTLFDPQADATQSIDAALHTANRENKHVLVEFGANNCDSCNLLHAAFTKDAEIAASFQKSFVLVMVDIDANQDLVSRYVQDQARVPFLALLNKEGKILKRRRTDDLEVGSKLDFGKVKAFLQQWSSAG
jgi:thiol-disulfide isomerase/thioredoxin